MSFLLISYIGRVANLERLRDGKMVFYRYLDKSFSINNMPLNALEIIQLKSAVELQQLCCLRNFSEQATAKVATLLLLFFSFLVPYDFSLNIETIFRFRFTFC